MCTDAEITTVFKLFSLSADGTCIGREAHLCLEFVEDPLSVLQLFLHLLQDWQQYGRRGCTWSHHRVLGNFLDVHSLGRKLYVLKPRSWNLKSEVNSCIYIKDCKVDQSLFPRMFEKDFTG